MADQKKKPFDIKESSQTELHQSEAETDRLLPSETSAKNASSEPENFGDRGQVSVGPSDPATNRPLTTSPQYVDHTSAEDPSTNQARKLRDAALSLFQSKRIQSALKNRYTPVIVIFLAFQILFIGELQNANAFIFLGDLIQTSSPTDALFKEAAWLDPKSAAPLYHSAQFWFDRRDFPKAQQAALAALKLNLGGESHGDKSKVINDSRADLILGDIESANYILGGSRSTLVNAQSYYKDAMAKDPDSALAFSGYAWTLYHEGKSAEAKKFYARAAKLAPDLVYFEHHSGFDSVQSDEPPFSPALGCMYEERSRWLGAKDQNYLYRTDLNEGLALNYLNLPQAGREHSLHVINKSGDRGLKYSAYNNLLEADRLLGDYKALERDIRARQAFFGASSEDDAALIEPLVFEGKYKEAIDLADKVLSKGENAWTRIYRSYAYAKIGNIKASRADAEKASMYDPFFVDEADQMSKRGMYKRAHDLLDLSNTISIHKESPQKLLRILVTLEKTIPPPYSTSERLIRQLSTDDGN